MVFLRSEAPTVLQSSTELINVHNVGSFPCLLATEAVASNEVQSNAPSILGNALSAVSLCCTALSVHVSNHIVNAVSVDLPGW